MSVDGDIADDVAGFSLGPDGLPGIRFDDARRDEFEGICDELIQRALEEHHAFHTSAQMDQRWKLVRQRDALSVYRHRTPVPPLQSRTGRVHSSHSSLMMGSGFLPGTINDTMLGVYCDTTETMRIVKSILSDRFIDGAMVHVFEKNSIRAPIIFSGIKWFAMQCPGGQLTHDRDLLVYERMGRIVDTDGNYFAYHTLQSIDLPEWPANRAKLRRAYLSMCYLYRQVNDHWVGCFILGDYDPASSMPTPIMDFVVSDIMLSVGSVLECAQAKRFSMLMLQNAGTPLADGRHCTICLASPGLFSSSEKSLQICVGCHHRVCRRCRLSCKVFRLSMRSRRPKKEWFCRECVGQVVVGPPRRNDWSADKDGAGPPDDVTGTQSSPTSNADSVQSDQDRKLHVSDLESLAELAQQWSGRNNQANGIVWNAEELARLSGKMKKGNAASTSMPSARVDLARSQFGKSHIGGKTPTPQGSASPSLLQRSVESARKSLMKMPFLKRSSSMEDLQDHATINEDEDYVDPNFVPGNSYSGGGIDWRTNAARLNASVSNHPYPPGPSSSGPTRKYSNTSTSTSSNASSTSRPRRRQAAPKAQSDEEMKRLYTQFMETMAKNRASRDGGLGSSQGPGPGPAATVPTGPVGNGVAAGDDPILQTRLVFDAERNEYVRVPIHRHERLPVAREEQCFSIDELD